MRSARVVDRVDIRGLDALKRVVAPVFFEAEPIKGSRFVTTVVPVVTAREAMESLEEVGRRGQDASHHCWAYRLADGGVRCSDAGEPSGTAGRPILARLEGRDLVDVIVVVSRWFGGTKLGAGGLVRAYGRIAGDALDRAKTERWARLVSLTLTYDYGDSDAVDALLSRHRGQAEYAARVTRSLSLPEDQIEAFEKALCDATSGRVVPKRIQPFDD